MEGNFTNPYLLNEKENLPNATTVLVLGILTIVFCWCCYVPSLTMGIIAVVMGSQGRSLYNATPEKYTETSYKNLNAGFICAIVGLALTVVSLIYGIINAIVNPNSMRDFERMMDKF